MVDARLGAGRVVARVDRGRAAREAGRDGCRVGRVEAARRVDEAARRVGETGGEDRGHAARREDGELLGGVGRRQAAEVELVRISGSAWSFVRPYQTRLKVPASYMPLLESSVGASLTM